MAGGVGGCPLAHAVVRAAADAREMLATEGRAGFATEQEAGGAGGRGCSGGQHGNGVEATC